MEELYQRVYQDEEDLINQFIQHLREVRETKFIIKENLIQLVVDRRIYHIYYVKARKGIVIKEIEEIK